MTIPREQTALLIDMWNEGYTTREIGLELRMQFGIYLDHNSIKCRAQKLIKAGLIAAREKGWNMHVPRLAKRGIRKPNNQLRRGALYEENNSNG